MKKRYRNSKKKVYGSVFATALASTAFVPSIVWSQTADATLRGTAAANSQITAKNIATGATRRTTAGADGTYALAGLPSGTYRVDAGPGTEQTVTLSVASTATLDLGAGGVEATGTLEEIIVRATRLVEVKTSEIGSTVSLHQIETTPQITRNFLEFADTVPGMVFSVDTRGNTSIQSGAQANSAINVFIDGVGQKNYVKTGGISGQAGPNGNGDPGNPFPQLAIGEYKVITSNYKAEYDQISSAAITAQTKSGTNTLHGELFGDYTNESLRAATPSEDAAGGAKVKSANTEYGLAVGGPIIMDAMHYFVTWEHKDFTLPTTVNPDGSLAGIPLATLLPAGVFEQFGPSATPFKENLYFAKVDWEPSDSDRIELSTKLRRETEVQGGSGNVAVSAGFNFKNEDTRVNLRWQHSSDRWVNEMMALYEKTVDLPTPLNGNPGITYTYFGNAGQFRQDIITINGADPRQYTDKHQDGWGIQDDLTFSNLHWMGEHTLKMGVKYKGVQLVARDGSEAAKYWYAVDASGTQATPFQVVFGKASFGLPLTSKSDNKQIGIYFQDDWAVNQHLTLNLGIRYDYEVTPSFENYKTLDRILTALQQPYPDPGVNANPALQLPRPTPGETYADALALGGININDYISTGSNRKTPAGEVAPRLGFSYDINADEKHVVFGGVGRAYDRNLFDKLQLENSKNALSEPTINFTGGKYSYNNCIVPGGPAALPPGDANGTTCLDWNPMYLNAANLQGLGAPGGEANMFPNNLKVPYSDQFSLGIRNKVGDWNTSVTLTRINSYEGLLGVLGNRYADGSFATRGCGLDWGGSPAQWCSAGLPGLQSNLVLWENGQETRTTELLVSAEKPYTRESHWGATFAYTFTDAKQNRLFTDGYGFDLPHIADYPFTLSSAVARHRMVATGSVDGPWGLLFAGKLTLATPIPVTTIAGCSQLGFANGTSCNAFGTNAYPVADAVGNVLFGYQSVDMQVTKSFDLPQNMSGYVRLDVLNLLNAQNFDSTAASYNYPNQPAYNTSGPIIGVTRTLKMTVGFKW
ncbi:MAG TPA: TonB-dependent receptor [Steroidobacteraceae bacterium]|nr:TonB-dependent receptor [Steroidobacteraceae bacterium]